MGTYNMLANVTQGDRPVYQRVSTLGVSYLYYWPSTSNWLIGSSYSSGTAGVKSTGNAACPDQATGWQAYAGGAWVSTYPITVERTSFRPQTPPATAPPTNVGKRSRYVRMRSV